MLLSLCLELEQCKGEFLAFILISFFFQSTTLATHTMASEATSSTKRRCLYEILEVPRDASTNDIRAAYKKQARKWHPDRNFGNTEEAEHMFKEISAAYEVLSDKNERAWYDAHREHILRGVQANENTDDFDLVPYFSTYAFSSFDVNEPNNFYAVKFYLSFHFISISFFFLLFAVLRRIVLFCFVFCFGFEVISISLRKTNCIFSLRNSFFFDYFAKMFV